MIGTGEAYNFHELGFTGIVGLYDSYRNCDSDLDCSNNSAQGWDPYANPCKWQYWQNCYEPAITKEEIPPDAFILGFSADTGGWVPSYTVGAEDLFFFDEFDVAAFAFDGPGVGAGASADIGYYGGFVWGLECVDCYSGAFTILTADLSVIIGAEITLFWAPGGDTWGFALAPAGGLGASVTSYDTNYVRLDEPTP